MNMKKSILIVLTSLIAVMLSSCTDSAQEKEAVSKVMEDYFSKLANDLRSGGVTGIEITSKSIKLGWNKATADVAININVYYPPTGDGRIDKDIVHFKLVKSNGAWVIEETKFDKTRF